eukprot:snap_masked-scaffold_2-processed-gene-7.53-mRNA-1 protein AED:1.00 eAED:1.00 QI:0/-1/0/0/-1/1/1/0/518
MKQRRANNITRPVYRKGIPKLPLADISQDVSSLPTNSAQPMAQMARRRVRNYDFDDNHEEETKGKTFLQESPFPQFHPPSAIPHFAPPRGFIHHMNGMPVRFPQPIPYSGHSTFQPLPMYGRPVRFPVPMNNNPAVRPNGFMPRPRHQHETGQKRHRNIINENRNANRRRNKKGKASNVSHQSNVNIKVKSENLLKSHVKKSDVSAEQVGSIEKRVRDFKDDEIEVLKLLDGLVKLRGKQERYRENLRTKLKLDLSFPFSCSTSWNASEILRGFLYVGAGFDKNRRCLVNNNFSFTDVDPHVEERIKFAEDHSLVYFLNMAASPNQLELSSISYPTQKDKSPNFVKSISMNDVDAWNPEMDASLFQAANFIQEVFKIHLFAKTEFRSPTQRVWLPRILVHCVAGVNRSALAVVFWLAKFHNLRLDDAWDLVVQRRDHGVEWKNTTLSGPVPTKEVLRSLESLQDRGELWRLYEIQDANGEEQMSEGILWNAGERVVKAKTEHPFPKFIWYKGLEKLLS